MSNLQGVDTSSVDGNEARDELQQRINMVAQELIKPGAKSLIEGLLQRKELNGARVRVIEWICAKERWKVELLETKEKVLAKPNNLLPCFEQQCTLELKDFVDEVKALTVQQAMASCLSRNDRTSSWNRIDHGYRTCPMLIWYRAIENTASYCSICQALTTTDLSCA
jgi:hypothetical protein